MLKQQQPRATATPQCDIASNQAGVALRMSNAFRRYPGAIELLESVLDVLPDEVNGRTQNKKFRKKLARLQVLGPLGRPV